MYIPTAASSPFPSPSCSSSATLYSSPLPSPQLFVQLLDPGMGGVGHEVLIEESVGHAVVRYKRTEGLVAGTVVAETVIGDDESVLLVGCCGEGRREEGRMGGGRNE